MDLNYFQNETCAENWFDVHAISKLSQLTDEAWNKASDELIRKCSDNESCVDELLCILRNLNSDVAAQAVPEKVAVTTLYGLFFLFGLMGNLLVIITVTLGKKARTSMGVDVLCPCLLTLALADLLIILFVVPLRVIFEYFDNIQL